MYAIIDVETTGGTARSERITEIAIALHDGDRVVDTFATLINPERSIPWNITQITGITDQMVANAPKFYEVARRVVEMTEGAIFVAHNAAFDYSFIKEEFARLGYEYARRQLCTVRLARKVFPGLPSYSLSNLKRHFGIEAERSHRALDDTLATAVLFDRILAAQEGPKQLRTLVNHGVREARLPPAITLDRLHAVPDVCGVYYLHGADGEVIYVGKSLNIRKRLFEHFADPTSKGEKLRTGVQDISFEVTGSELVALLLESAEIKRLQPRVNRAQRIRNYHGALFTYLDPNGYRCLLANKRTGKHTARMELVNDYPKLENARNHLETLVRHFELCHKLCHLDFHDKACFYHSIKQCYGACIGQEPPEAYNLRVEEAIANLGRRLNGNYVIVENGRSQGERAYVGVRNGAYSGFGFVEADFEPGSPNELFEILQPPAADPEAERIIQGYVTGKKARVIAF
jgi:DNA polymerase-3 subunit epsilon